MNRVSFWVPLLLLVLILKQSHEDSDQFSDGEFEHLDFETYMERIRELEQQNETCRGECKEQLEKGKRDSDAAFTSQKFGVEEFKSNSQKAENITSIMNKQLEEKGRFLQNKNEELLQMQSTIDGPKNTDGANVFTVQELRVGQKQLQASIDDLKRTVEPLNQTVHFVCGQSKEEDLAQQRHTLQTLSRKLNESEMVNSRLQSEVCELKIKLEQSASINNDLKKQLEAKEEVVRSKNEIIKQMQTTIDGLKKKVDSVNQTVEELCGQYEDTTINNLTKTVDSVNQTVEELCGQYEDACEYLFGAIRHGDVITAKIVYKCSGDNCTINDAHRDKPLTYAARIGQLAVVRVLLEGGANLEGTNPNGVTALHQAAFFGYLELCRLLLDSGANVDPVNKFLNTPLHDAAARGHLSVAKLLVERGADVRMKNEDSKTPSELARRYRKKAVAQWLESTTIDDLTKKVDSVNKTVEELCGEYEDVCQYLFPAIQHGDVITAKIVYKCSGDNCTINDAHRDKPLTYAARIGQLAVVRVLLEGGANLEGTNPNGVTALHQAAFFGYLELCRLLLDSGANVDPVNKFLNTPLHDAAARGHLSVAKLLVERGADVRMKNEDSKTPSELARSYGKKAVAQWLESTTIDDLTKKVDSVNKTVEELCGEYEDVCQYLFPAIQHGDVITAKIVYKCSGDNCTINDAHRDKPLTYAARIDQLAVVRVLLEGGANLEGTNPNGVTALHQAAFFGYLELCRLLLDSGANVDPVNKFLNTPLHDAAARGHLSVAKLLVERGADVRMKNEDSKTPSELARSYGKKAVAQWLESTTIDDLTKKVDSVNKTVEELCGEYEDVCQYLFPAIQHGDVITAKILYKCSGDNCTTNDAHGDKPLIYAARIGQVDVVRVLLEGGANLEGTNPNGVTALHQAASFGHLEMCRLLLDSGANVDPVNKFLHTPLYDAAERGHLSVAKLLVERGADVRMLNEDDWFPS